MAQFLIVGHDAVTAEPVVDWVRNVSASDPVASYYVVVPERAEAGLSGWELRRDAIERLDAALALLKRGLHVHASGEVGSPNALTAVRDVLRRRSSGTFEAILVATLPQGLSRWWDVPAQLRDEVAGVRVDHVTLPDTP